MTKKTHTKKQFLVGLDSLSAKSTCCSCREFDPRSIRLLDAAWSYSFRRSVVLLWLLGTLTPMCTHPYRDMLNKK